MFVFWVGESKNCKYSVYKKCQMSKDWLARVLLRCVMVGICLNETSKNSTTTEVFRPKKIDKVFSFEASDLHFYVFLCI